MQPVSPFILNSEMVRRALPMRDAIECMREAFGQLSRGEAALPTRMRIDSPADSGVALIMACHSSAQRYYSIKAATVYPGNPNIGLPTIQSSLILISSVTGSPVAIMDGASLTAIRTGAASGVATDLLSNPTASTVAIIGAGVQARTQLEAVCCVRSIRWARVYCRNFESARRFAEEMSASLAICVEAASSPAAALADADIVCTATPSRSPVFADSDLMTGAHINAVGAFKPEMIEIPSETVIRAFTVVDHFESACEEAGDLLAPLSRGEIKQSHFETELGDLQNSRTPGRTSPQQITLFKSVGVAIQDLCAAVRVVENFEQMAKATRSGPRI